MVPSEVGMEISWSEIWEDNDSDLLLLLLRLPTEVQVDSAEVSNDRNGDLMIVVLHNKWDMSFHHRIILSIFYVENKIFSPLSQRHSEHAFICIIASLSPQSSGSWVQSSAWMCLCLESSHPGT